MNRNYPNLSYIDSHTEGEPTRVIVDGMPFPFDCSAAEIHAKLQNYDHWMSQICAEPRGREALVAAILGPSPNPDAWKSLVFFNAAGTLSMCGHGLIGVAETLRWLGELPSGTLTFDTPAGLVSVMPELSGSWTIENVPSYVLDREIEIEVSGIGLVHGAIAYGGNWFFLVHDCPIPIRREFQDDLMAYCKQVLKALQLQRVWADEGIAIDHIELCGDPILPGANSKNFVLCPDQSFDRSPCGTGTSAHIAYQASIGRLKPGKVWVQESFTGTTFSATYEWVEGENGLPKIKPRITGRAEVVGRGELYLSHSDIGISGNVTA